MFTSIVVGIDGSPPSLTAAHAAMNLAARDGCQLHLVSVIEEIPRYVAVREEASREETEALAYFGAYHERLARDANRQGVIATTSQLLSGHEVQQLLAYADEVRADLLVIGHAGHSGVWGPALGSTASQLLRRARCSTLVVRAQGTAVYFARVAVALDGSPLGWEAFETALDLAHATHHPLHVISALERAPLATGSPSTSSASHPLPAAMATTETGPLAAGAGATQQFLVHVQARAAARAAAVDVPVDLSMRSGPASDALVRAARELGADLLVAGATGHERPWSTTTGATALKVAEEAPCAVLLVRPRKASSRANVREIMRSTVTVTPDTPADDVLTLLLDRGVRLVPVVQPDGTLAGVVTLDVLLRRVDPEFAAHLSGLHTPTGARNHLEHLTAGRTVRECMVAHSFTVHPDIPLEMAGRYLTAHHVTRAPVVDAAQQYLGIISERDIVGALLTPHGAQPDATALEIPAGAMESVSAGTDQPTAGMLADRTAPALPELAAADEVVQAVHMSRRGLVMVVDDEGRLVGIVDESALLGYALPPDSSRWLLRLARSLPRLTMSRQLRSHTHAEEPLTASSLMRSPDLVLDADCPLSDALALLLKEASIDAGIVVGDGGHPLGPLWRSSAVRALVRG